MRILLTGGTGFLGKAVADEASARGHNIGLLVRDKVNKIQGKDIFFVKSSMWTVEEISSFLVEFRPDLIIHMVGTRAGNSPLVMYRVNTCLAVVLLEAAKRASCDARIVLVGSAAEYGLPLSPAGVSSENDACRPLTSYGISKLAQTLHGQAAAQAGQAIAVVRPFNLVGKDLPLGNVLADLASRISRGSGDVAVGNINVARDFIAVEEAARVIMDISETPASFGRIINVSSGVATPLNVAANRLRRFSGRDFVFVPDPTMFRNNDVRSIKGSTQTLESLGIRPASRDISASLDQLMDKWLHEAKMGGGN
jgi:nucleoside-diphosphate-sugar epimerase